MVIFKSRPKVLPLDLRSKPQVKDPKSGPIGPISCGWDDGSGLYVVSLSPYLYQPRVITSSQPTSSQPTYSQSISDGTTYSIPAYSQ
nr:MAG TPA: hypothetical protein [Caudoviricetes sp.]